MSNRGTIYFFRISRDTFVMRKKTTGIVLSIGVTLAVAVAGCVAYYVTKNENTKDHDFTASTPTDKLVIDTDAGGDDAMAILLVLSAWSASDSNFEVIGITCTYGNTYEANVEINVLKTLTIANASQIPVYGGVQKPLITNYTVDNYFGEDGFGDFEFNETITAKVDRTKHAAVALVELARQYRGELSILVLGPPTNIAVAIALDPNFMSNIKRLYIMGGSVAGGGNKAPGIEYNFGHDPESNFVVLNSTRGQPALLYPWEPTLGAEISLEWRTQELGSIKSKYMNFMNQVERKTFFTKLWRPADVMVAAVMIWPNLAKKSLLTNVTPVIYGEARGGLLVDYRDVPEKPVNVEIVQEIEVEEFKRLLLYYFS